MKIKDIIVILTDPRGSENRISVATALAQRAGAHVIGLYLIPTISLSEVGLPYAGTETEIRALEEIEEARRAAAHRTAGEVERALAKAAGLAGLVHEWRVIEGDVAATAALHARHCDIAVVGQTDPDHPTATPHLPEAVLLGSGRPVLIVPYAGHFESVGKNVLVAWNASREAARAVNDAMAILQSAEQVRVFSVNPEGQRPWPGADIALHMARHGAKAETTSSVSHDIDAGNVILSRASDFGSDLIVMGGYGHSRQREFILGGVTRTMLQHMTVPVLMSH
ncbi:MAG TPA: universal stress protein [Stellaceae bacterium]|nr:universal stress protein [Stellaceae bacterium]